MSPDYLWPILLLALLVVLLGVLIGHRALRRKLERYRRRRDAAGHNPLAVPLPSRQVISIVVILQLTIVGLLVHEGAQTVELRLAFLLGSILLFLIALFLHGLPQHDRSVKYAALWMGIFCYLLSIKLNNVDQIAPAIYFVYVQVPLTLLVGLGISYIVYHYALVHDCCSLHVFALHRLCMLLTPRLSLTGLLSLGWLTYSTTMLGYLVVRYFVRPYVTRHPFLYLRSFEDASARRFVAQILTPSVGTRGVIVGLVHDEQTGEELHRTTEEGSYAALFAVPDSAWQNWVISSLGSCTGVVLDMSIPSASIAWELDQALRHLPPDRILVISRTAIPEYVTAAGVETLVYSLESWSQRNDTKAALLRWTANALQSATTSAVVGRPIVRVNTAWFSLVVMAVVLWTGSFMMPIFVRAILVSSIVTHTANGLESLSRMQFAWHSIQHVAGGLAALLLLCASHMFPVGRVFAVRAYRLWLAVPCVLVALCQLGRLWPYGAMLAVALNYIGSLALAFAVGYILLSCLEAYTQAAQEVTLGFVTAMLLPSLVSQSALPKLEEVAVTSNAIWPLWGGTLLVLVLACVAANAFTRFVRSAVLLRAPVAVRHQFASS